MAIAKGEAATNVRRRKVHHLYASLRSCFPHLPVFSAVYGFRCLCTEHNDPRGCVLTLKLGAAFQVSARFAHITGRKDIPSTPLGPSDVQSMKAQGPQADLHGPRQSVPRNRMPHEGIVVHRQKIVIRNVPRASVRRPLREWAWWQCRHGGITEAGRVLGAPGIGQRLRLVDELHVRRRSRGVRVRHGVGLSSRRRRCRLGGEKFADTRLHTLLLAFQPFPVNFSAPPFIGCQNKPLYSRRVTFS